MKYFFDTEFLEGKHRSIFGRRHQFIDLISIGMVSEDGRKFYAISKQFDIKRTWNNYRWEDTGLTDLPGINRSKKKVYWIRENVLKPIWQELKYKEYRDDPQTSDTRKGFWDIIDKQPEQERLSFYVRYILIADWEEFSLGSLTRLIKKYGKSHKEIMQGIVELICPITIASDWADVGFLENGFETYIKTNPPEFYAYYASYDWVLFCSLFGTMMDLPKGFARYCRDLKQMLDEAAEMWPIVVTTSTLPSNHNPNPSFNERLDMLKSSVLYPKHTNEHNALADAQWNLELYKFLRCNHIK